MAYSFTWGMNNASPDLFLHCTWTSGRVLEGSWANPAPGYGEEGEIQGRRLLLFHSQKKGPEVLVLTTVGKICLVCQVEVQESVC